MLFVSRFFHFLYQAMIILLSPAKTLDFSRKLSSIQHSEPYFAKEANQLVQLMQTYTIPDLLQVMKMSENLAHLTYDRFQNWDSPDIEQKQAGAAFKGEAYKGLDLPSLNEEDLDFAQEHLIILSGIYGILRPYDLIKPYRLEMGSKLKKDSLYTFWTDKITNYINNYSIKNTLSIINLASQEYFSVIAQSKISTNIITPVFKEIKDGKTKTIVVYAKKARGLMARFIIENKITQAEEIKEFNKEGYQYNEKLSNKKEWFFTR